MDPILVSTVKGMFQNLRINVSAYTSITEFYYLLLYIDTYYTLVALLVETQLFSAPAIF
jgi:hypothetical protein